MWRPNNWFSFCVISSVAKIWKTTFTKEFFNEIWLKLGDHEYIYIAEIKFGQFYSGAILGGDHFILFIFSHYAVSFLSYPVVPCADVQMYGCIPILEDSSSL